MPRCIVRRAALRRVVSVVKVRGSSHSKDVRFFDIEGDQITVGERLAGYAGILSGQPVPSRRGARIKKNLRSLR